MFSVGKCDHAGEFRTQEISVFIPGKIMIVIYTRKYINLLWHKPCYSKHITYKKRQGQECWFGR